VLISKWRRGYWYPWWVDRMEWRTGYWEAQRLWLWEGTDDDVQGLVN
jgi:hypothetical protein